jgi:hypothetical protein
MKSPTIWGWTDSLEEWAMASVPLTRSSSTPQALMCALKGYVVGAY